MSECYISVEDKEMCLCDNCGHRCRAGKLEMIHDIQERLDPGGVVPAGECPKCGAFSYLVKPPTYSVQHQAELVPILLAALKDIVDSGSWHDDGSFVYYPPDEDPEDEGAIGRAVAAIKKAEQK